MRSALMDEVERVARDRVFEKTPTRTRGGGGGGQGQAQRRSNHIRYSAVEASFDFSADDIQGQPGPIERR